MCNGYYTDFNTGFALGTQIDSTDTTTDCAVEATTTSTKAYDLLASLVFSEMVLSDILAPVVYLNQIIVSLSNQQTACKSIVRIKQFQTRVSSFSGMLDLAFTIGYGYYA